MLPLASTLDELCREPGNRAKPWTNVELAKAVQDRGGDIGHAYIAQLRKGHKDNPTSTVLTELAAALGVHPAVFVGGRRRLHPGERAGWRSTALRRLFEQVHPAERGPYSPEEVATSVNNLGSYGVISRNNVRALRDGTDTSPRLKHVLGLAAHFGVHPAYFFDSDHARHVDHEIGQLRTLAELGVLTVVTRLQQRAAALSPEIRQDVIDRVTRALDPRRDEDEWTFAPHEPR